MSYSSENIKYLFLISKYGDDYISTSFNWNINGDLILHNFEMTDLERFEYLTIDYTTGDINTNFYNNSYNNSKSLKCYQIVKFNIDTDRKIAYITIKKSERINLIRYKRQCQIERLLR
jgi:hypothetical protein